MNQNTDPVTEGRRTTPLETELAEYAARDDLSTRSLPRLSDYIPAWDEPIPADGHDWPPVAGDTGEHYGPMPTRIEVQGQ